MTGDRTVRLMSDYLCEFPLWHDHGFTSPERLGLSEGLATDLRAWQRLFDDHCSWNTGWDDEANAAAYATLAPGLATRLRTELGPDVEVLVDLWPVEGGPPGA